MIFTFNTLYNPGCLHFDLVDIDQNLNQREISCPFTKPAKLTLALRKQAFD